MDIVQQGNSGNAVASKHVTLAYNKLGQFTSFNRYESTGTSSQVASTDFTYDTLNRLTDIDHKQGSTVLASYDYAYDFISRITSVDSSQDGVTDYSYDANNQVTGADHTGQTDETYSFNANGSRTGSGYSVSTNNLTTSDGTYNYTYDDEGNRTQKTAISGGAYTTYSWDYRNRLAAVKDYSNAGALLKETTYNYDTHNRLVKSSYDADGSGAGIATTRYWAFVEGIDPLLEFKGSSASDVSHRYLWGPAVDQLFADEQPTSTGSAGNVLWSLGDNLGTIRDIADLSGSTTSVTNHRRFGAYGNLVSESNAAIDMVFAYTGKLYDENTQLQNNLFRWYDATTGQWMSEDPLGFAAGDENVRRYVGNRSTKSADPSGLQDPLFPPPMRQRFPSYPSDGNYSGYRTDGLYFPYASEDNLRAFRWETDNGNHTLTLHVDIQIVPRGIPDSEVTAFACEAEAKIEAYFSNSPYLLVGMGEKWRPELDVHFLNEPTGIQINLGPAGQSSVNWDTPEMIVANFDAEDLKPHVTYSGSQMTIIHEFGHILGLRHPQTSRLPELGTENIREYSADDRALMGTGMEYRTLYFENWRNFMERMEDGTYTIERHEP